MDKNKLDCIEMLISQSITDLNISHEEFKAFIYEKRIMAIRNKIS